MIKPNKMPKMYKHALLFTSMFIAGVSVQCSASDETPYCGDGIVNDQTELCDGNAFQGEATCRYHGYVRGVLNCDDSCRINFSACESDTNAVCGNGVIEIGEECDIEPAPGLDCERLGLGEGEITCSSSCTLDTSKCTDHGECGDGQCSAIESCAVCPQDCGACPSDCGDLQCDAGENCETCPGDCGACPPGCGDGQCSPPEETCNVCPQDCSACPPECGDGQCNGTETCNSCPGDCGICDPFCGDDTCNGTETCDSCEQDCGSCGPACGDNSCNGNETCNSCEQDCGPCAPFCGDNACNGNETCNSCEQDCGECPCQAANYWSPTSDSQTDPTGQQADQTINVSIEVEVRQSGEGLEVRVCKPGDTFMENVAFHIYDDISNNGFIEIPNLGTANSQCSAWVGLSNDTGYLEGEQFSGVWQMISPAWVKGDWNWPADNCTSNGDPWGTCWSGSNITMTRTCKGL